MERLKAILADRILDLTSVSGDDVKAKVEKMQRFRDFASACQTLMTKYPLIEDELIKMVNDGDFDTKVASSRVDSVIRLAYNSNDHLNTAPAPVAEEPVAKTNVSSPENFMVDNILEEESIYHFPEDIDYEEVAPLLLPEDEKKEGYSLYEEVGEDASYIESQIKEEVIDTEDGTETVSTTFINTEHESTNLTEEQLASMKRKATIRKVVQIIGIILVVIVAIIVIKFIINHWIVILSSIGGLAVIAIIIWFLKKKKS